MLAMPLVVAVMIVLLPNAVFAQGSFARDDYGGIESVKARGTGFFRVEKIDVRWWFITPDGHGFISKGVCGVKANSDEVPSLGYSPYERNALKIHGDETRWADATEKRLREWGFNTIGGWSAKSMTDRMPYTLVLNLAAHTQKDTWLKGLFPDVFEDEFENAVRERARDLCAPLREDHRLIGYFTDNELRWSADHRSKKPLLDLFLELPQGSAGRKASERFIEQRHTTRDAINDADRHAWLGVVAERYFSVCGKAVRDADPNHLLLGSRFVWRTPEPIVRAAGKHMDVISFNSYEPNAPIQHISQLADWSGRPVMLTEFSFKARDSGLPNEKGGGKPVETQADRASGFERISRSLAGSNVIIGYHWFKYSDQPAEGRFDGENCNYGLVRIDDSAWELLTEAASRANERYEQHRFDDAR